MKYRNLSKQTKQKIVTYIKEFINNEGGLFGLDHWTVQDTGYTRTFSYLEQVLRYLPNISDDENIKSSCGLTNEDLNDFELIHDLLGQFEKDTLEDFNSPEFKEELKRKHKREICEAANLLICEGWEVKNPKAKNVPNTPPIPPIPTIFESDEDEVINGQSFFDTLTELAKSHQINAPAADGHN